MDKKRKYTDDEINELKEMNKKNFRLIDSHNDKIRKIKEEINKNKNIIQDNCEHDLERISEYGERTYYCCKICNYDTRFRIIY